MRLKYIPAAITLAAGAIISILNIINKVDLTTSLKRLLWVLLVFYIIGLIAKTIIAKTTDMTSDKEEEDELKGAETEETLDAETDDSIGDVDSIETTENLDAAK
ncbi:MAG: hypothetical protein GX288_10420 [Clostridiales bacterium]|nr:hypothetical protein [Clostridiales bacterium]